MKQIENVFTKTMLQIWEIKYIALIKDTSPLRSLIVHVDQDTYYGLVEMKHLREYNIYRPKYSIVIEYLSIKINKQLIDSMALLVSTQISLGQ